MFVGELKRPAKRRRGSNSKSWEEVKVLNCGLKQELAKKKKNKIHWYIGKYLRRGSPWLIMRYGSCGGSASRQ